MYKTRFNIGDIVMERKDNAYSTSDYLYRGNFDICKKNEGRIPFVGIITGVQKRIYRTEEGEEIFHTYTMTGNDFDWYEHQLELVKERGNTFISTHTLETTKEDALNRIDNLRKELEEYSVEKDVKIVVDLDVIFVKQ